MDAGTEWFKCHGLKYGVCHQKWKDDGLSRLWFILIILLILAMLPSGDRLCWNPSLPLPADSSILLFKWPKISLQWEFQSSTQAAKIQTQTRSSHFTGIPISLITAYCNSKTPLYSFMGILMPSLWVGEWLTNPINQPYTMTQTLTPYLCLKIHQCMRICFKLSMPIFRTFPARL